MILGQKLKSLKVILSKDFFSVFILESQTILFSSPLQKIFWLIGLCLSGFPPYSNMATLA